MTEWIKAYGAMGLAWTRLTEQGETSSYEKFLAQDEVTAVRNALGAETGDVLLLVASPKSKVVFDSLGADVYKRQEQPMVLEIFSMFSVRKKLPWAQQPVI